MESDHVCDVIVASKTLARDREKGPRISKFAPPTRLSNRRIRETALPVV
jgi:hypothetical protein